MSHFFRNNRWLWHRFSQIPGSGGTESTVLRHQHFNYFWLVSKSVLPPNRFSKKEYNHITTMSELKRSTSATAEIEPSSPNNSSHPMETVEDAGVAAIMKEGKNSGFIIKLAVIASLSGLLFGYDTVSDVMHSQSGSC